MQPQNVSEPGMEDTDETADRLEAERVQRNVRRAMDFLDEPGQMGDDYVPLNPGRLPGPHRFDDNGNFSELSGTDEEDEEGIHAENNTDVRVASRFIDGEAEEE